jgi:hypothetical protein
MALGDQIGEASGTITGTRVIKSMGTQAQIEVSFQGSGTMLGQDITDIGTYWQTLRAGGVLYGEGDVLYITGDGESAHWTGFGVGRPTGPFPAGHFAVCGSTETESGDRVAGAEPPQRDCHRHRIRRGPGGQLPL